MTESPRLNVVVDGVLVDREGQEWTTKHSRWATAKQAAGFIGRDAPVGLIEHPGGELLWMHGDAAQQWWAHAKRHFDVPGTSDAEPDQANRTWSAHIWQRGDARLAVFEAHS
jgi:hypothetical protein